MSIIILEEDRNIVNAKLSDDRVAKSSDHKNPIKVNIPFLRTIMKRDKCGAIMINRILKSFRDITIMWTEKP